MSGASGYKLDATEDAPVRRCETCRWSSEDRPPGPAVVGQVQLLCRRYPPTSLAIPQGPGQVQVLHTFPAVTPDAWCGEWTVRLS